MADKEVEHNLPDYDNVDLTPEEREEVIKPDIIVDVDEILAKTNSYNIVEEEGILVADFANKITTLRAEDTAYDIHKGKQKESPFLGEPPYIMNNSMFVYWAFHEVGIELGDPEKFNIQLLKRTPKLREVANAGSGLVEENILPGDVVFFFPDSRHAGIYVGDKSWVGFNGTGINDYHGGAEKNPLDKGYWADHFYGHVKRFDKTTKNIAKPL